MTLYIYFIEHIEPVIKTYPNKHEALNMKRTFIREFGDDVFIISAPGLLDNQQ